MDWSHIHVWWIKISEEYLGSEESQSHTRPLSLGFQCQEDKSPQFLAAKNSRDWVSRRNFWSPKQFLLTHTWTHLLRCTPSELQHQGGRLKGTSGILGETEVSGIKVSRGHCPFSNPSPYSPTNLASWCHIWDSIKLANTVCPALEIPWESILPNLWVHPTC